MRDVVNRVQCEMQKTVTEEVRNHPRLVWLAAWSARVHMTLVVDDTASLTPGVLVTAPFHNAYATVAGPTSLGGTTIGAIPQFFSLGVGGGASTEAVRTEDLEFDLSFKELKKNFKDDTFVSDLHDCVLGDHLLLDGDPGLYEWMDAALGPAADKNQILKIGKNPPPGGGGVAIPVAELSRDLKAQQDDLQKKTKAANGSRDQLKALARLQTLAVQTPDDRSVLGDIELVNGAEGAKALIAAKLELSRATLRVTRDLYGLVITPIDHAASHLTCDDKFGKALAKAEYDVALANSRAVSVSSDDTGFKDVAELTNSLDTFKKAQAATERDDARKALIAVAAKAADDGKRLADIVGKQTQEQNAAAKSAQDVLTAFTVCQTQSDRPDLPPEGSSTLI